MKETQDLRDETFLKRACSLAMHGEADVSPNPTVGAVLAFQDKVIGEGYHQVFGQNHAEVNCLESVPQKYRSLIPQSTMYVSLEPCSHHGKTPPCVDAILKAQVPRVVIAMKDPYEKVAGKGIIKLKTSGVQVILWPNIHLGFNCNRPFLYSQRLQRPYITLKWAQSKDGFIGRLNEQTKISNPISDTMVHHWRSKMDAILVGTRTALIDNPKLSTRLVSGSSPIRIVIDRQNIIPETHHLYSDEYRTWTFSLSQQSHSIGLKESFILPEPEEEQLTFILKTLRDRGVQKLLVEGGAKILNSFINQGLWDEARVITSNDYLCEGVKAPFVQGHLLSSDDLGTDCVKIMLNKSHRNSVLEALKPDIS